MKNLCRNCKHWTIGNYKNTNYYPEDLPPDRWYIDGVCTRLGRGIIITTYGGWEGSGVDYIETDANFGCVLFEARE